MFYIVSRVFHFLGVYRSISSAVIAFSSILIADQLFRYWIYPYYEIAFEWFFSQPLVMESGVDMGYAPEVWLALLAMVLGTLIIVISIASQSIPKLIDLYMQDWWSLFYVWILVGSIVHATLNLIYQDMGIARIESQVFNVHILLSSCLLFAFPYIYYILKRTKPSEVIQQIFNGTRRHFRFLTSKRAPMLLKKGDLTEEIQFHIFEAANQLSDLLHYVSFKEPKAEIIHNLSQTLQNYVHLKKDIPDIFFKIHPRIYRDISFKTMVDQFGQMEETKTFYEQKCFRVFANIYIHLLESGDFELSSLCVSEITNIGRAAIEADDQPLLENTIIRFNTTLRFAIKHGVSRNEARNLYNAAFHYGAFIEDLVHANKVDLLAQSFFYLRIYGTEIFKHGRNSPSMYFIVDVFAAEMKKVLMLCHQKEIPFVIQEKLLGELLQIDSPPDMTKDNMDKVQIVNNGVRVIQMGLGLYYLKEGVEKFVDAIVDDVLDDLDVLGATVFRNVIENTCNRLNFSGPSFWEDTDRGTLNIYYTSDQKQIEPFKALIYKRMDQKLKQ